MWQPPINYVQGGFGNRRKVNSDGTITIICRICEKEICKEGYRGFSTAMCAICHGEIEKGKSPDEILAAIKAGEQKQVEEIYNDIGPSNARVIGIGARAREIVRKVKEAAVGRRRGNLLSKKDEI